MNLLSEAPGTTDTLPKSVNYQCLSVGSTGKVSL